MPGGFMVLPGNKVFLVAFGCVYRVWSGRNENFKRYYIAWRVF